MAGDIHGGSGAGVSVQLSRGLRETPSLGGQDTVPRLEGQGQGEHASRGDSQWEGGLTLTSHFLGVRAWRCSGEGRCPLPSRGGTQWAGGSWGRSDREQSQPPGLQFVGAEHGTHAVPGGHSASQRRASLLTEHRPPSGGKPPGGAWGPISDGHREEDVSGDPETGGQWERRARGCG